MTPALTGTDSSPSAPYFFLSYAHTPEQGWVSKLFEQLCAEVWERTKLPMGTPPGFMDRNGIPLGSEWRREVGNALATCRVFVPLYSPRYFIRAECGKEWHAFAQRMLDHHARRPQAPPAIVPALWTPVDPYDLPDVARRIQFDHAGFGDEYAQEGLYTLIKNSRYEQAYVTAVQRLAKRIVQVAESDPPPPCGIRELGPQHDAFDADQRAPADRRLTLVAAAPTVEHLPAGRSADYYGPTPRDWNPFHPASQQSLADYAVAVARTHSYEPTVLTLEEGCDFFSAADPGTGLGLLLVDAWTARDEASVRQLRQLDELDLGWMGAVVPWNAADPQTREHGPALRSRLAEILPNRLGAARRGTPTASVRVATLEQFRAHLPEVLDGALYRLLNHIEAHPPEGPPPPPEPRWDD